MSVIVMGMEMPTDCALCVCSFCAMRYAGPGHSRPEWCPLVELPEKHGRLIDLDALLDRINGEERPKMYDGMDEVFWIQKCLEEAPTIVEPEGD